MNSPNPSFVPVANANPPAHATRHARTSVVTAPISKDETNVWLTAAQNFEMNTDFDVGHLLADRKRSIQEVVNVMKVNSGGKGTIQALGDKIVLSKLLENLGIPQMPVLFSTYSKVNEKEVEDMVSSWKTDEDFDVVIKPTHLSSATGAIFMCKTKWEKDGWDAKKLTEHMETYLQKKASDSESEALKSLVPGFVVQPRYRSSVGFNFPLELRVVTVWGKARVGIWWWGRHGDPKGRRSTWLVRKPKTGYELSDQDDWEVIHDHRGGNRGFEVSLKLFQEAMPVMSAAAEAIATAVGAPFLRSDFFVGNSKWGVRLNEVAYGSGVDYRRRLPNGTSKQTKSGYWVGGLADDGPAIAEILQEGFKVCQRKPPAHFLRMLGAKNAIYEASQAPSCRRFGMTTEKPLQPRLKIEAVPVEKRLRLLPEEAVREMIQRYDGPENVLSQTGMVQASSCETQPAPDRPITAWPFPGAWGNGGSGYTPGARVMANFPRSPGIQRIPQPVPLQASPSAVPVPAVSVPVSAVSAPVSAPVSAGSALRPSKVYPYQVPSMPVFGTPLSPWAVSPWTMQRSLRPTVVA